MSPRSGDPGEPNFRDQETERELEVRTRVRPAAVGRRLLVVSPAGRQVVELPARGELLVGRGEGADLRLDDPKLSRRHVRLTLGERVAIEDLGSANGTVVAGARLPPGVEVGLAAGQVVELGDVTILLEAAAPPVLEVSPEVIESEAMRRIDRLIERVAAGDISVLVLGETGVGKERTAEKIHGRSPRRDGPFVRVNAAALSASLIESELFGYQAGAFTGATVAKIGLLEAASGGTVFLDEVGELPLSTQVKLLRVLEDRVVLPVGGVTPRRIDVRVVAATNRDLAAEVAAGRFRADLYYRLDGVSIVVPPLRERREEVPALARYFARELGRRDPALGAVRLDDAALALLAAHDWPGNVRELKNVVERAVLLAADEGVVRAEHLPLAGPSGRGRPSEGFFDEVARFERARILEALERAAGNQTEAAKLLGIGRRTLIKRLDEYGVKRPRKGAQRPTS